VGFASAAWLVSSGAAHAAGADEPAGPLSIEGQSTAGLGVAPLDLSGNGWSGDDFRDGTRFRDSDVQDRTGFRYGHHFGRHGFDRREFGAAGLGGLGVGGLDLGSWPSGDGSSGGDWSDSNWPDSNWPDSNWSGNGWSDGEFPDHDRSGNGWSQGTERRHAQHAAPLAGLGLAGSTATGDWQTIGHHSHARHRDTDGSNTGGWNTNSWNTDGSNTGRDSGRWDYADGDGPTPPEAIRPRRAPGLNRFLRHLTDWQGANDWQGGWSGSTSWHSDSDWAPPVPPWSGSDWIDTSWSHRPAHPVRFQAPLDAPVARPPTVVSSTSFVSSEPDIATPVTQPVIIPVRDPQAQVVAVRPVGGSTAKSSPVRAAAGRHGTGATEWAGPVDVTATPSGTREGREPPRKTPLPAYPGSSNTGVSTTASGSHQNGLDAAVEAPAVSGPVFDHRLRGPESVIAKRLVAFDPTFSPD
jgi:hypothetical protein